MSSGKTAGCGRYRARFFRSAINGRPQSRIRSTKIFDSSCHGGAARLWFAARKRRKFCIASLGTARNSSSSVTVQNKRMTLLRLWSFSLALALILTGCGEPERSHPAAVRAQPFGGVGEFNQVGTVSLYPGESCASQIMFIFHGAGSTSLAAPWRQSTVLREAANAHRRVRVIGQWRRGKAPGCTYVEATQVEVQKSFW